jgi:hypothetical protein
MFIRDEFNYDELSHAFYVSMFNYKMLRRVPDIDLLLYGA